MKKIFLVMAIIFLAGLVIGQTVGTIISQQTFDQIDFKTKSLEMQIESKEITDDALIVKVSYLTLNKQEDGTWIVVRENQEIGYPLELYHECRVNGFTKGDCVQNVKERLLSQAKSLKTRVRNFLEENKTKSFIDELTTSDIVITEQELNQDSP